MAEAAVSMVLDRLASLVGEKIRGGIDHLSLNVKKEDLQALSSKLERIRGVLADAEWRGVTDPKVETWLDKLKDIAYEIEDALDEWEVENIKQRLRESEDASESSLEPRRKKVRYFPNPFGSCSKQPVVGCSIALDIKRINQRLDSIAQENENEYKFISNLGRETQDFKQISPVSFAGVSEIHGRDDDKRTLVSIMLSESSGERHESAKIVSIVGAGGMGKTALAQLVFNDPNVNKQFEVKIWICVSDPFDEIKIAKSILEELNKSSPNLSQFQTLLGCIHESISGKKFLLVLDDVWIEDDIKWKTIRVSLNSGALGSKILVTTRKAEVAKIMGSIYEHSLEPLEDKHCWSILSQIAFHERGESEREEFNETGWELAKKCKGLPLAAKTLGGLLRLKSSPEEWQCVLKSETWEMEGAKKIMFPFLTLSYNELDPAVKRCFSYCAIFEKDKIIEVNELIKMWMAQGYLYLNENATEMEVKGHEYFEELAMRSFFQDFEKDGDGLIWRCKMHDIVHHFAQFLTKNECLIVKQNNGRQELVSSNNARHVNVIGVDPDALYSIYKFEKLRSLLFLHHAISPDLFSHLKRVRLLILRKCDLRDIPKEIGNLIHMRNLDLSHNEDLKELPETICGLYNLQTFVIEFCRSLSGLPGGIDKLINLRHLLNSSINFKFPQALEKLTDLRTLEEFRATKSTGNKLRWLRNLNQLGGTLRIDIDDSVNEAEAKKADLTNKKLLRELKLVCSDVGLEVLEALQPHPDLRSLEVTVLGLHLPTWITTLTNLRRLDLCGFLLKNPGLEDLLPALEKLTLLEELTISQFKMERVGYELLSIPLSRLKKLKFAKCIRWEEWEDISSSDKEEEENDITSISFLPSLRELEIWCCVGLKTLPHRLLRKANSLEFLEIYYCENLQNRYNRKSGRDWDKISHIPRVGIERWPGLDSSHDSD